MMIRLETDELEMVISIALKPASAYALRSIVSPRRKLDRQVAIDTLTALRKDIGPTLSVFNMFKWAPAQGHKRPRGITPTRRKSA